MKHLGIFSDSLSLPPKEGISVHVIDLLNSLSDSQHIKPILFMCDRGFITKSALRKQKFTTVVVPEKEFFQVDTIMSLIHRYRIDIAQTHKTYIGAALLGPACLRMRIPMVAEVHDIENKITPLYFTGNELKNATTLHMNFQNLECQYASLVRVMSKYDYNTILNSLEEDSDINKYHWIPVGATPIKSSSNKAIYNACYIGNMAYKPNADGAVCIYETIAPADETITYVVAGRQSQIYNRKNIEALGEVDMIEDIIASSSIGIAPIFEGSGMKIKILTYLKCGKPVLTTSVGAHGYPSTAAIIVEDDILQWPNIIHDLLHNKSKQKRLSQIAQDYFTQYFSIDYINDRLTSLLLDTIRNYNFKPFAFIKPLKDINPEHMYWLKESRNALRPTVNTITEFGASNE